MVWPVAGEQVARVRIGRVKLKDGGADLRIFRSGAKDTECRRRIKDWSSDVLGSADEPHAFFAIAFRLDPDCPGGLDTATAWWSDRLEIQYDLLPVLATEAVRRHLAVNAAEAKIMRNLGYSNEPDDDAS